MSYVTDFNYIKNSDNGSEILSLPGLNIEDGEVIYDVTVESGLSNYDLVQYDYEVGKWVKQSGQPGGIYLGFDRVRLLPIIPYYSPWSAIERRTRQYVSNFNFNKDYYVETGDQTTIADFYGRKGNLHTAWVKKRPGEVWDTLDEVADSYPRLELYYIKDSSIKDEIGTFTKESSLPGAKISDFAITCTLLTAEASETNVLVAFIIDAIYGDRGYGNDRIYQSSANNYRALFGNTLIVIEAQGNWSLGDQLYYEFDGSQINNYKSSGCLRYGMALESASIGDKILVLTKYGTLSNSQKIGTTISESSKMAYIQPIPAIVVYNLKSEIEFESGWWREGDPYLNPSNVNDVEALNDILMIRCYRVTTHPYSNVQSSAFSYNDRDGELDVPPIAMEYNLSDDHGKMYVLWAMQSVEASTSINYDYNRISRPNNYLLPAISDEESYNFYKHGQLNKITDHESWISELLNPFDLSFTGHIPYVQASGANIAIPTADSLRKCVIGEQMVYMSGIINGSISMVQSDDASKDRLDTAKSDLYDPYLAANRPPWCRIGRFPTNKIKLILARATEGSFAAGFNLKPGTFTYTQFEYKIRIRDRSYKHTGSDRKYLDVTYWTDAKVLSYVPNRYEEKYREDSADDDLDCLEAVVIDIEPHQIIYENLDQELIGDLVISTRCKASYKNNALEDQSFEEENDGTQPVHYIDYNIASAGSTFKAVRQALLVWPGAGRQPIPYSAMPFYDLNNSIFYQGGWFKNFPRYRELIPYGGDLDNASFNLYEYNNAIRYVRLDKRYPWRIDLQDEDDESWSGDPANIRYSGAYGFGTKSTKVYIQVYQYARIEDFKSLLHGTEDKQLLYLVLDRQTPIDWSDQPIWNEAYVNLDYDSKYNDVESIAPRGNGMCYIPRQSFDQEIYIKFKMVTSFPSKWNLYNKRSHIIGPFALDIITGRTT